MVNDVIDEVTRNKDGTFMKGYSGNYGNKGTKLSKGQKMVREFAISMLPQVFRRFEEMIYNDETPLDIRVKICNILIDRAAGKIEEAPTRDDDDDNQVINMSGQKVLSLLNWAMENSEGKKSG